MHEDSYRFRYKSCSNNYTHKYVCYKHYRHTHRLRLHGSSALTTLWCSKNGLQNVGFVYKWSLDPNMITWFKFVTIRRCDEYAIWRDLIQYNTPKIIFLFKIHRTRTVAPSYGFKKTFQNTFCYVSESIKCSCGPINVFINHWRTNRYTTYVYCTIHLFERGRRGFILM